MKVVSLKNIIFIFAEGYTSISVREPLINILVHANQNSSRTNAELIDSHYTTVSDDSGLLRFLFVSSPRFNTFVEKIPPALHC